MRSGFIRSTENQTSTIKVEDIAMPYFEQFTSSCHAVRTEAIGIPNKEILRSDYHVPNDVLPVI